MTDIFDNLLVSSPNGGGLFFIHNGEVFQLDDFDTTGLSLKGTNIIRGVQPSSIYIYSNEYLEITEDNLSFDDIHDVKLEDDFIYFVGTSDNEIVKVNYSGEEIDRWSFAKEKDSWHINSLTKWNNKIVFSAFGEFEEHRGYKGHTQKSGFIQDLSTGERLITGLSQPHSLLTVDNNLFLANSEKKELREYNKSATLIRTLSMDGYTRGIFAIRNILFVGLSRSRNIGDSQVGNAILVALDFKSWDELGRIHLPTDEIYEIQGVSYSDDIVQAIANIASHSSSKLVSKLAHQSDKSYEIHNASQLNELKIKNEALQKSQVSAQEQLDKQSNLLLNLEKKFKSLEVMKSIQIKELEFKSEMLKKTNTQTEEKITRKKGQIQNLEKKIKILEHKVLQEQQMKNTLAEKINSQANEKIADLNQQLKNIGSRLKSLEIEKIISLKEMQLKNESLRKANFQVDSLQNDQAGQHQEFNRQITSLESDKNNEIHRLHMEVERLLIKQLEAEKLSEELLSSKSWKVTSLFRALANVIRQVKNKIKYLVFIFMKVVYKKMPLSIRFKQKLKGGVFKLFSFSIANTIAYKQWEEYESSLKRNNKIVTDTVEHCCENYQLSTIQNEKLKIADGTWEWSDYKVIKLRINQVKKQFLSTFEAQPLPIIDIKTENLVQSSDLINFPEIKENITVSIVIPVYNNLKYTLECLLSISHYTKGVTYEVIVANDASNDETETAIKAIPNIRLITNQENLGFLRNCNNALKYVKGKYVLFLNNDVQVTKGWLEPLLKTFDDYSNVGAVGPLILYPSGCLQEAGVSFSPNGSSIMVGLNENPNQPRFSYVRRVDYVSGACLLVPAKLLSELGGFSDEFAPSYCEDSDLCLKIQRAGYSIYNNPGSIIVHHLSVTTAQINNDFKLQCISKNLVTLSSKWQSDIDRLNRIRCIAFYLPQFHSIPENDEWWGKGFTEWTNVTKAQPNFLGHYQPRIPAELGYYDLRENDVLTKQADLAKRYGIEGFCFYYYWFGGKRLLEAPIEEMLKSNKPDFPFCLCWANENWTRRWDGMDQEILISQTHSVDDDFAVIKDLIRYFKDNRYIRIDGKPLILVYRVSLFPEFKQTAARWRSSCISEGIGEIYISMVESFELVQDGFHPSQFGCDASVEFPPHGMAEQIDPCGEIINKDFQGGVADYRDFAVTYATRELPNYTRFRGVMPGWDNTARRQNNGFCFEHATPGAFQAWIESVAEETRQQQFDEEQIIFINAWNEWAEGAHLEPDQRFGHSYLEAVHNALEKSKLVRKNQYEF